MTAHTATAGGRDEHRERDMRGEEKRTVALLGVPTLALALATTTVTTYLPVAARDFVGSTIVIGLIIGMEGVLALWVPLVVGAWSDRLNTRIGGRLPFLVAGSPILAVGLVALGFVGSAGAMAIAAFVFFSGYFLAYEPYRALYPDAISEEIAGRAQGTQALWRGGGTGLALLSGGLLLAIGQAAPFIVSAVVFAAAIGIFVAMLLRRGVPDRPKGNTDSVRQAAKHVFELVRGSKPLRAFLVANALWELSLGALKTFIVLYVSAGLGFSRSVAGLIIGGVAVLVLLAALACGKLADRVGQVRVLQVALPLFGLGLIPPLLSSSHVVVALSVPFVAAGGGAIMALPYAVLMPLMPKKEHGVLSGYYSFSRGLGTWMGPMFAGLAVSALSGVFSATRGYQAMWLPVSAAALLSLIPLRTLKRARDEEA